MEDKAQKDATQKDDQLVRMDFLMAMAIGEPRAALVINKGTVTICDTMDDVILELRRNSGRCQKTTRPILMVLDAQDMRRFHGQLMDYYPVRVPLYEYKPGEYMPFKASEKRVWFFVEGHVHYMAATKPEIIDNKFFAFLVDKIGNNYQKWTDAGKPWE